jgi:hypothetical protein
MKKQLVASLACILAVSAGGYAQTPNPDVSKAQSQPCVIVKRHVHKFGENMSRFHAHRPFDYVEGTYPAGFKWRSELGDGDVRELQQKGGKMVVMRPDYQVSDLDDARKQCQSQTVNNPGPSPQPSEER